MEEEEEELHYWAIWGGRLHGELKLSGGQRRMVAVKPQGGPASYKGRTQRKRWRE